MSWRGTDGAFAAARAGHDVVMAPSPVLYLDHLQGDSPGEPPGRPAVETLEDVYAYEPVPPGLAAAESSHIVGAQLNAWTEHMRLPERVEHQAFPRIAALAEVTWSAAAMRNWPDFASRLPAQLARYRKLGIHYADSAFEPRWSLTPSTDASLLRVGLSKQVSFGAIRYTRDGSDPSPASAAYEGPFEDRVGTTLEAAAFDGERRLSTTVTAKVDPTALNRRTSEELTQCTGKLVLRLEDDSPLEGERAVFNVDIVDPCWIWPHVDLTRGATLRASVGQLPFNFQIGKDADAIRRGDARTGSGELEVRAGDCSGEPVAVIPLQAAAGNPGLTTIGPVRIPPQPAGGRMCLRFARPAIDPVWAIQWVALEDQDHG
jgi:hexosaminidase